MDTLSTPKQIHQWKIQKRFDFASRPVMPHFNRFRHQP
jgi:hypothetical protein